MNYWFICYPDSITPELKARYEEVADAIEKTITKPICLVWAHEDENWEDDDGKDCERECLLITEHKEISDDEWTYGKNLMTIRLY